MATNKLTTGTGESLKVAGRYFYKNRSYMVLNLLGLATGFAVFIFGVVYVWFETNFENFHEHKDNIYRATYRYSPPGEYQSHWARIPFDYINNLPDDVPGVNTLIRLQNHARKYVQIGDQKFKPAHAYVTDPDIFNVFSFTLINGDAKTALREPHAVVLSQSLARKYFGDSDPVGREISVIGDLDSASTLHHVTGVMEDLPANTHLPVDMLLSFRDAHERTGWAYTYILLDDGADIRDIASHMPSFIRKYSSEEEAKNDAIIFQALPDIHLGSSLARELVPNGRRMNVNIVGWAAVLILVVASVNFMNLNSAMALGRGREVGVRKILGASQGQLIRGLLSESVMYNLMAMTIAGGITYVAFPYLKEMITVEFLPSPLLFASAMIGVAVLMGLLSGIYPVMLLTALKPVVMLKTTKALTITKPERKVSLKQAMVTLQFSISILLCGSAVIGYHQVKYLQDKNLGIEREQVIAIPGVPDQVKDKFRLFKDRLSGQQGIRYVSACMEVPSREIRDAGPVLVEGINSDPSKAPIMDIQVIDHGFASLMGLTFVEGRNVNPLADIRIPEFTKDYTLPDYLSSQPREYLINETAMHQLGWPSASEALGQKISWSIGGLNLASGSIVGIVKDYHQESLKNKVDPVIMVQEPVWLRTFLVKVEAGDVQASMEKIHAAWNDLFPFYPMEYFFLDDLYDNLYNGERVQLRILMMFSALAVLIAFIGLIGLVAYALQTRNKELAIRQVLGAQIRDLIGLMSREYIIILVIGGLIAVPLSIYILNVWLDSFAYHAEISPWSYVFTFFSMMALLLITVGLQTLKASRRNAAQTLRDE